MTKRPSPPVRLPHPGVATLSIFAEAPANAKPSTMDTRHFVVDPLQPDEFIRP